MRIQSLQVTGFKSFVDKTLFTFGAGITGIVGPNGCGKSNVVDAIRWAMGEQAPRRLRGKGMEDVIFAGSELRAPVGMSEVVLSFANTDGKAPPAYAGYSEIQVSRRLYRSGESEYLINKVPVRLRDVLDFFRDTGIGTRGYTIVEQGRIAEIVSAKPEERRTLIEEAAGISKYKARRREAERKLEATEQNLLRVTDVVNEIRRQIASIERQAKKAARYKRLRETQRLIELSLASEDRDAMLAEIEAARGRVTQLRDASAAAEARLAEREADLESQRLALVERERALGEGSEALFRIRGVIKELETRIGFERRERASLAEANEARSAERDRLEARRAEAQVEAERLAEELRAVEAQLASAGEARERSEGEASRAREALRALEGEREASNAALVDVLTRVARAEDRLAALADRRAELDRRLRGADDQLEVHGSEASEAGREETTLEEGLRNLLAERDRLMGLLRDALPRHEAATVRAREAAEQLAGVREERETQRARLASLRELDERREDLGAAARYLLEAGASERLGLRGLVRDVLDVEPEVERAVAAVLGERAEGLVAANPESALAALRELRAADAGHGIFVVDAGAHAAAPSGFVPLGEPLLGHVRARPGFEGVARALLGGVNLVDDLGEVVRRYGASDLPCAFVTPAGDWLAREGVVRGGAPATAAPALGRPRRIADLAREVDVLDARVRERDAERREADAELARASDELDNLRSRHHTAALAVANHEKDLERARERAKALGQAREVRVAERASFVAELEALAEEGQRLEQLLSGGREQRSSRQHALDALGLRIGSATRELTRLDAVATERRVHHDGRAESRERLTTGVERAAAALGETLDWIAQREAEIRSAEARREELAGSITQAELQLGEEIRSEETARLASEQSRDAYERAAAEVREREESARAERLALSREREVAQQSELALRELELKLDHLETQVRDRWNVEIASWKPPVPAHDPEQLAGRAGEVEAARSETASPEGEAGQGLALDDAEEGEERDAQREARANAEVLALASAARRGKLAEVRRKLEAIGEVNLGAIEEHEELRERHRFLDEQKTDLESSVSQLRDAISRINRTSRKRFRETFDAVDERFRKNFPRLFRGGKASLSLTESEDVLEAGIEIMAQPPGKRLQSVNLLSGGEKTMTAIALLVSVFQVRPSPFFLLDEVDAALDDANVGRFNEIMLEMARDSQFLLITHNKRTIEVADLLYGVTMEERGVSKLVAVELS